MVRIGSKKDERVKLSEIMLIILVVFYVINFEGIGTYLLFFVSPFVFLFSFKTHRSKMFFLASTILALFGITYAFITYYYDFFGLLNTFSHAVFPICLYILGYTLGEEDFRYKKTYTFIYMLLIGLSLYILLSYLWTLSVFGSLDVAKDELHSRSIASIWDGSQIKATVVTVFVSFGLALVPTLFIRDKSVEKTGLLVFKCINLFCFFIAFFITIQMSSRTAVIIVLLSFLTVYFFSSKLSFKKTIITPAAFIIFLILIWGLYKLNIFKIRYWWESTAVYSRFQSKSLGSDRYEGWKEIIQGLLHHPMGGREIDLSTAYAHNLWLDVVYDAGIVPFILLIIFTLIVFVSFIKFTFLEHPPFIKTLLVAIYTAFFVSLMTEPILATFERFYFVIFCLIVGLTQGLNKRLLKVKNY